MIQATIKQAQGEISTLQMGKDTNIMLKIFFSHTGGFDDKNAFRK